MNEFLSSFFGKCRILFLNIFIGSLLCSSVALADAPTLPFPGEAVTMPAETPDAQPVGLDSDGNPVWRLLDLNDNLRIYRGTLSVPGEFPAMGWIGNCTATPVAPNVVFTAAHCQTTGAVIYFQHRASARSYRGVCTQHPEYNTVTIFNDYTFCKLDESLPAGSVLGTLVNYVPAVGTKLLINGYGEPNVRTHYWGSTSVRRYVGQDIESCGPSNLGRGDSGGALLAWTEDRTLRTKFEILGVNSRGNTSCDYYNMTASREFQSFARSYEQANGVRLCGISASCSNSAPAPTPPDESCRQDLAAVVEAKQALSEAVDSLSQCMAR